MSAVPLHVVCNVAGNFGAALWDGSSHAKTLCGVALKELVDLKCLRVLPFGVTFPFVNEHCLIVVAGHLVAILVSRPVAKVLQTGLVDHPSNDFLSLGTSLASLPSWDFKQVILWCVQCQCNWIGAKDVIEVLPIGWA